MRGNSPLMEGEGMINQEQLNAIKERVKKATPGQWKVSYDTDDREHVVDIWFDAEENGHAEIHDNSFGNAPYNAKFISHAREDVPALVAEVERLNEELTLSNVERMSLVVDKAYEKSQKREYIKTLHLINEQNSLLRKALEKVMEVEAPIMEGTEGWETRSYEIARKALGGETK